MTQAERDAVIMVDSLLRFIVLVELRGNEALKATIRLLAEAGESAEADERKLLAAAVDFITATHG